MSSIPPKMSAPLEGPSSPRRKANPTTIVLVVVSGLAATCCVGGLIFAAVLFPVFRQARLAARGSICSNNLRQIGASMAMYTADNDDRLPIANRWIDLITIYKKQGVSMRCPEVRSRDRSVYGYAFNKALNGKPKAQSDSNATLVFDSTILVKNATSGIETLPKPGRHIARGTRYNNMLMLDGSVRSLGN